MNNTWILAQADSADSPSGITSEPVGSESQEQTTTTGQADPNGIGGGGRPSFFGSGPQQFIFIGLMLVMMYLILFRGPRKKQQQHKQMMQALAKNDKVQTIGGIIGTVVDIKDEEITLKIDESNNTKMKILRSAISRNMSKDKS
ncbi:MAG TPA: preprotein translocase subunit YajC [Phycisphaerales bacterium]|nr:preprotein translocase subunit YajC [Phycisphaerales bacterium]